MPAGLIERYNDSIMSEPTTFGAVLRKLRQRRDWSQRSLAFKYGQLQGKPEGIATSVIAAWESDRRKPSKAVIGDLGKALRATPQERDEMLVAAGFLPEQDQVIIRYRSIRYESSRKQVEELVKRILEEEDRMAEEERRLSESD